METETRLEPILPHASQLRRLHQLLVRQQMLEPVLLFLTGHQPLAFLVGHSLLLLAPLAEIVGWSNITPMAGLLLEPDAAARLEAMLHNGVESTPGVSHSQQMESNRYVDIDHS